MPAYLVVQVKFKDMVYSIARYGRHAMPMMEKMGGEVLAGSMSPHVLEDSWDGNWAALVKFKDMATAEAFCNAPEYKPLKDLRMNELTEFGRVLLVEGSNPAPPDRASSNTLPAYLIAQTKFKATQDAMVRYWQNALPAIKKMGGDVLVGSMTAKVIEGEWDGNWASVVRFKDMATAEAFYNSPEYKPLKELCTNELTESNRVLLAVGFTQFAFIKGALGHAFARLKFWGARNGSSPR